MYTFTDEIMGLQPIAVTDTVQRHPIGMITHATDPVLGGGEFIYLKGAASTVAGSLVTYNPAVGTTLSPAGALTGVIGAPVAVAMSANVANQFGWYQISGQAIVAKDASVPVAGAPVYLAAAAGQVTATQAAGRQLESAQFAAGAATGVATVAVTVSRPAIEGQIT
jgi:hypothetical protein